MIDEDRYEEYDENPGWVYDEEREAEEDDGWPWQNI